MAIKTLTLIWLEVTFTVNRIAFFFNDKQLLKHFWSFSKRKLPVMLGSSQKSSCLTHFENLLMSFCHERLFWVFLDFFFRYLFLCCFFFQHYNTFLICYCVHVKKKNRFKFHFPYLKKSLISERLKIYCFYREKMIGMQINLRID